MPSPTGANATERHLYRQEAVGGVSSTTADPAFKLTIPPSPQLVAFALDRMEDSEEAAGLLLSLAIPLRLRCRTWPLNR